MQSYHLTPAGRRATLVLLVAALIILAIAIWALRSTVGSVADAPELGFFAALQRNLQQGMGVNQLVPALLLVALVVATPLVCWNLIAAYGASYTPSDDGLHFAALGIHMVYPWSGLRALRTSGDAEEPAIELEFDRDYTGQIRNPLLRLLHVQAYGRRALPIPVALDQSAALLAEIAARSGLALPAEPGGFAAEPTDQQRHDRRA